MAIVALRLDWVHYLRYLHLYDRTDRGNLSHQLPRRHQGIFWYLGFTLARLQQGSHGMRMSSLDILWSLRNTDILQIWYGVQAWIGGISSHLLVLGGTHTNPRT